MDILNDEQVRARAEMLKAMGNPTRLRIIEELGRSGERCVCELRELVGLDMSTVSKHLSVLKRAGLVQGRKVGLQVYYDLTTPCVLKFFACMDDVRNGKGCCNK